MRLQGYMEKRALHFIDPEVQDIGLRLTQELVTILSALTILHHSDTTPRSVLGILLWAVPNVMGCALPGVT